jgi:hypothetical protein
MTVKWQFYDPDGEGTTYNFSINPDSYSSDSVLRNIKDEATSFGSRVFFEGRKTPRTFSFSGTILSEDQYNVLYAWANERRQIRLTDDLGFQNWIYIKSFNPTRQLKPNVPWYFTYSIEAVSLDWQ